MENVGSDHFVVTSYSILRPHEFNKSIVNDGSMVMEKCASWTECREAK